jgi:hypothetical protein
MAPLAVCRRELVEGHAEPVAGGNVGGEFVVAAPQILHKRMTGGQDPRTSGAQGSRGSRCPRCRSAPGRGYAGSDHRGPADSFDGIVDGLSGEARAQLFAAAREAVSGLPAETLIMETPIATLLAGDVLVRLS